MGADTKRMQNRARGRARRADVVARWGEDCDGDEESSHLHNHKGRAVRYWGWAVSCGCACLASGVCVCGGGVCAGAWELISWRMG